MRCWVFAIILMCSPILANADARWAELVNSLRAEGIETVDVDWISINNLCLSKVNDADAYYDCRYPLAQNYARHKSDAEVCRRMERKQKRVTLPGWQWNYPAPPKKFESPEAEHQYYRKYHQALRYGVPDPLPSFDQCMADRGWRDGLNWRAGRLESLKN